MTIRCRVGWHRWTLWTEPFEESWGRFAEATGVMLHQYVRVFQTRRCQDCRETEKREVRA